VTVVNFVPSTIRGSVFIDRIENVRDVLDGAAPIRDGIRDANEQGLGSVPIMLIGNGTTLTAFTEIDGSYEFENVAPGNYQVVYNPPANVISNGPESLPVNIGAAGGVTADEMNFALFGLTPSSSSSFDILARTYLNNNGSVAALSNGGREGGVVSFGADGRSNFVMVGEGFADVRFVDIQSIAGTDQDVALLTVLRENGDVLTTQVSRDRTLASPDGNTFRFFGGLDDFTFTPAGENIDSYDDFQTAIDQILADIE